MGQKIRARKVREYVVKQGQPAVAFMTLKELAYACQKRSKYAFQELMDRGIIPDANFRGPSYEIKRGELRGTMMAGERLYSRDFLVPKLVKIFSKIQQGKQITPEQRLEIALAFEEEVKHFQ